MTIQKNIMNEIENTPKVKYCLLQILKAIFVTAIIQTKSTYTDSKNLKPTEASFYKSEMFPTKGIGIHIFSDINMCI